MSSLDNAVKIGALFSSLVIIPTFGWVWHTNTKVERLTLELQTVQEDVKKMEPNTLHLELVKKDIEVMKQDISEIKAILMRMSQ